MKANPFVPQRSIQIRLVKLLTACIYVELWIIWKCVLLSTNTIKLSNSYLLAVWQASNFPFIFHRRLQTKPDSLYYHSCRQWLFDRNAVLLKRSCRNIDAGALSDDPVLRTFYGMQITLRKIS